MAGVQHHRAFHQLTAALPVAAVGHPERDLTHDGAVQGIECQCLLGRAEKSGNVLPDNVRNTQGVVCQGIGRLGGDGATGVNESQILLLFLGVDSGAGSRLRKRWRASSGSPRDSVPARSPASSRPVPADIPRV